MHGRESTYEEEGRVKVRFHCLILEVTPCDTANSCFIRQYWLAFLWTRDLQHLLVPPGLLFEMRRLLLFIECSFLIYLGLCFRAFVLFLI